MMEDVEMSAINEALNAINKCANCNLVEHFRIT